MVDRFALGAVALLAGAGLMGCQAEGRLSAEEHLAQSSSESGSTGIAAASGSAARAHLKLASLPPAARQDIDYSALDARIQKLMTKPTMVGMAVGVVENGRITFLKGYGETVAGSGEPVTTDTVFRWASVSKGVAATMVAKLAAQSKVDLQAPVVHYSSTLKLPQNAEFHATVGNVLSHQLGLYRHAYDNKLEEGQETPALRQNLAQLNLICKPGSCWSYQNVAYDAASEIVERVTGKTYAEALQEQLFNPIGMKSASVTRAGLVNSASWARPHTAGRRTLEVNDDYYRVPAAGGVNSNIKDLALWLMAQTGAMPDVLSPQLLGTIHERIVKTPGERARMRKYLERISDPYYGYGWRSYDFAGHRVIGHHGGVSGYRSLIMFDPEKKSGVVAMWNSNTGQPWGLEIEVMDRIYGLPFRDWLGLDALPGRPPEPSGGEQQDADVEDPGQVARAAPTVRAGRARAAAGRR
jgi:beta-lactamase class C